jgi:hypothetical protein
MTVWPTKILCGRTWTIRSGIETFLLKYVTLDKWTMSCTGNFEWDQSQQLKSFRGNIFSALLRVDEMQPMTAKVTYTVLALFMCGMPNCGLDGLSLIGYDLWPTLWLANKHSSSQRWGEWLARWQIVNCSAGVWALKRAVSGQEVLFWCGSAGEVVAAVWALKRAVFGVWWEVPTHAYGYWTEVQLEMYFSQN